MGQVLQAYLAYPNFFVLLRGKNVLFNATKKNNKKKPLQEKCDKKVEIETPV